MKAHSLVDKTTAVSKFRQRPGGGIGRRAVSGTVGQPRGSSSLLLGTIAGGSIRPKEDFSLVLEFHKGDLPDGLDFGASVAIDTETLGLNTLRDRLCVVQLSAGDGVCHIVHFPTPDYAAPNLSRLVNDQSVLKLFHFARFDVAALNHYLGTDCRPVYCTKIASRLTRTYTDRHGLRELCRELLGVDLSKEQQSSDWGAPELTEAQLEYAANDVLYLHRLKDALDARLEREGRTQIAQAAYEFLPVRAAMDIAGFEDEDIFAHS